MALFSSLSIAEVNEATSYFRAPIRDRLNPPDPSFIVWATVVLTGLAIMSIALALVAPMDPSIFVLS